MFIKRIKLVLGAAALISGIAGQAQAIVLADARGDSVAGVNNGDPGILSATGTGSWNYLASDTANPTLDGSLDVMTWNGTNSYRHVTTGGSQDAVDLLSASLALDEIRMHPSASIRPPAFAVVRWITGVGEAGLVNITGNVRKVDTGTGDGVSFDLFVDGVLAFSTIVAFNDNVGAGFNHNATVSVGSTVDFVVGAVGFDTSDSTGLKATISGDPQSGAVPEPATLAIFSLGLAGLGFARRRKQAA